MMSRSRLRSLAAIGLLFGIFSWFYAAILSGSGVLFCCDNLVLNIPARLYGISQIAKGVFPLWNPYILSGTPYLADINLSPLYPANIVFAFFSTFEALTIVTMLHIAIAAVGMYVFARSLEMDIWGRSVAVIIYVCSGAMLTYTNNLPMVQVAAYVPWIMYCWQNLITKQHIRWIAYIAVVQALQIIAGHPQLTYYTVLCGLFILLRSPQRDKRILLFALSAMALSVLLAAIQIVPFLEFALVSTRNTFGWEYAVFGSLQPLAIARLIVPYISGNSYTGTSWIFGGSIYGYVGLIPLVLVFGFRPRRRIEWTFVMLAIISLLFALGKYSPLYTAAYYLLPGFGSFRVPQHLFLVYTFSVAILAGMRVRTWLIDGMGKNVMTSISIGAVVLLVSAFVVRFFAEAGFEFLQNSIPAIDVRLQRMEGDISLYITDLWQGMVISGLVLALFIWISRGQRAYLHKLLGIVLLITIELSVASHLGLYVVDKTLATQLHDSRNVLSADTDTTSRIYIHHSSFPRPEGYATHLTPLQAEALWQNAAMRPNLSMLEKDRQISGYASMVYSKYQQYWGLQPSDPTGVSIPALTRRHVEDLGISSVIVEADMHSDEIYRDFDVLERREGLVFLKSSGDDKFVYIVHDDGRVSTDVDIVRDSPDHFVVHTNASGKVVYADMYYPGWLAYVDGAPQSMEIYSEAFKAVSVTEGKHTVEFLYRPLSVRIGSMLTALGAVIVVILLSYRSPSKRLEIV